MLRPTAPTLASRPAAWRRASPWTPCLLAALVLTDPAGAADPGSLNRIDAPPCPVLVTGPGTPVALDC